jgi:hypothetical protein
MEDSPLPKKPVKGQGQKQPIETDVLRKMLSTPPEPQKAIPKTKKAGK